MRKKKMSVKDKIAKTMLDILGDKNISEIRISELTEKADVARASFYRNFNSIDEVIDYIASQYAINFNEQIMPMLVEKKYDVWYEEIHKVLTEIYDKRANYTDILSDNLRIIFYRMQEKNKLIPNHDWQASSYIKYEHIAKITGFYSVCMAWVQSGAKESIDDMTKFMLDKVLLVKNY